MSLDAMDWVWNRAKSRGNARLVLLAVADKVTGPEATARMGTAEVMRRLAAARSTARAAVDAALKSGELVEDEPAIGSRAALYRIPGAVGYSRTGPSSGPLTAAPQRAESRPPTPYRAESRPPTAAATGPESGPLPQAPESGLWSEIRPPRGPDSGPHQPPIDGMNEGVSEAHAPDLAAGGVPPFARPLVDRITAAQVYVGWDLTANEWLRLDAMLRRSGADMLAQHAVTIAGRREVSSARYFLRAWTNLPPAPTAGTVAAEPVTRSANVIPLDRSQTRGRVAQSADYLAEALAAMEAQQ
ncbi:hypothetical protein OG864_29855 [Streptomyces sp. NBC_00124]|uniref:hypothetical protein n=1 Tax=Streptomyces sp. NBC_00124 TaxID=2975662 RepID=UPI00224CC013|nr:hypothetical protein [Streptomyces sp. NBC_00124]MCX5362907.1 hypothetical protein [Streptomyces sp. NBC_00124]